MQYAKIEYMPASEIDKTGGKLHTYFRKKYIEWFPPLKITNTTVFGEEGFNISIPNNERGTKRLIGVLIEKGIKFIINKDNIPLPDGFTEINGILTKIYLLEQILKMVCKIKNIDLGKADIIILDDGSSLTPLVIHSIKNCVNTLWIHTPDKYGFVDIQQEILEETGLAIECFSESNKEVFDHCNIIINCSNLEESISFKRGVTYIDITGNKNKLARLEQKRKDIFYINDFEASINSFKGNAIDLECFFLINNNKIYHYLSSNYFSKEVENSIDFLLKTGAVINKVKFTKIN